jgi:uncharacterized protein (TIGR03435 family)
MRSRILVGGALLFTSVVAAASRLNSQSAQPLGQKRLSFEVASVKSDQSDAAATSRFALGPGDAFAPGALFAATNQPLIVYLRFAYKLGQTDLMDLPGWVYEERFDIEARAPGTPTKDGMRLMMQSLMAERFELRTHTERRTQSMFHLVLVKAGKTGPQLQRHPDDGSCTTAPRLELPPIPCGSVGPVPASRAGRARIVANGVTMTRIANFLKNPSTGVDRPVIDHTGLSGAFDMSVEWSLAPDPAQPFSSQVEDVGPTFLEALRQQLGLTLKSTKGLVDVLVIDHVERPAPD